MRWIVVSSLMLAGTASAETKEPPPSVLVTATATSNTADAWKAIDHQTPGDSAWCGNDGDSITFTFEKPIPITSLDLAGGIAKKSDVVSIPAHLEVTAGSQKKTLDGSSMMKLPLDGSAVGAVTVKLVGVKGKGKGVCLSGIRVGSPSSYYYGFVYGLDRAALDKLVPWATKLDAAMRACDRAGLANSIAYPIKHDHTMEGAQTASAKHATYKNVDAFVAACKDGPLARGYAGVRFDDLTKDALQGTSSRPGEVQIGSGGNNMWLVAYRAGAWQLREVDTWEPMDVPVGGTDVSQLFDPDVSSHAAPSAFVIANAGTFQSASIDGEATYESEVATFSRDGNAVWIAFDVAGKGKTWRATELAFKDLTKGEWQIAAGLWSTSRLNGEVNKAAAAGKLALPPPIADKADGDAELRAAFDKLLSDGLDATAAARKELIAIGSGPNERTKTGAALAKPWKVAWAKKLSVRGGAIAKVLPSGTTGWVMADVLLDKGAYKVPFRVFVVFDKTSAGAWSLVQAHFAVL